MELKKIAGAGAEFWREQISPFVGKCQQVGFIYEKDGERRASSFRVIRLSPTCVVGYARGRPRQIGFDKITSIQFWG